MAIHHVAVPDQQDHSLRELRESLRLGEAVVIGPNDERRPLPPSFQALLVEILNRLNHGESVTLLPEAHELTTDEEDGTYDAMVLPEA